MKVKLSFNITESYYDRNIKLSSATYLERIININ